MKTLILIGDSIRMEYQQMVKEDLAGTIDVWWPEANGGNSKNVLDHLDEWAISRSPDIVHINSGLHDINKEFSQDARAVPLDEYTANVREILGRIQSETSATVVWASTTPVNEEWHHKTKPFDRLEADNAAYNEAAAGVACELNVPVNDLFNVVQQAGRDELLYMDGVHFKHEGYVLLGQSVADFIRALPE